MVPSGVRSSTPAAAWGVGATEGVVPELLAGSALGVLVEAEVAFNFVGGGKGRQTSTGGKFLRLGACDGDDNCGHPLSGATIIRGEPAWRAGEGQAGVEGRKFLANVG